MDERVPGQYSGEDGGWPRWVKVLLIAATVAVLIAVAVMLLGSGGHNPGRHVSSDGSTLIAATVAARLSVEA